MKYRPCIADKEHEMLVYYHNQPVYDTIEEAINQRRTFKMRYLMFLSKFFDKDFKNKVLVYSVDVVE